MRGFEDWIFVVILVDCFDSTFAKEYYVAGRRLSRPAQDFIPFCGNESTSSPKRNSSLPSRQAIRSESDAIPNPSESSRSK